MTDAELEVVNKIERSVFPICCRIRLVVNSEREGADPTGRIQIKQSHQTQAIH